MISIKKAVLTEKSLQLAEQGQYSFVVAKSASKQQIAHDIKVLFNVTAQEVRVISVKGKVKKRGRFVGTRPSWRKAIVRLAANQKIAEFSVNE